MTGGVVDRPNGVVEKALEFDVHGQRRCKLSIFDGAGAGFQVNGQIKGVTNGCRLRDRTSI